MGVVLFTSLTVKKCTLNRLGIMRAQESWIQGAVIYQIYPRSFYDSNSDGVGDLQGIIEKLDHLGGTPNSLGVNAVWISPFYTSPMADFGYDVADYCGVDPLFGSLDDFKLLLKEARKRNIKVLIDFVPNHSSDKHLWFKESRSSKTNPKRDWYIWRDPAPDGEPPNNWRSVMGSHAWTRDKKTGQYYLHTFLANQPDLNWDNPEVREAMKSAMRFWLDLGVDGFRVDAVPFMSKDHDLKDDPVNPRTHLETEYNFVLHRNSRDGPQLFDWLNEMADVLKEYPQRYMITEGYPDTLKGVDYYFKYYNAVDAIISTPFSFEGLHLSWKVHSWRQFIDKYQAAMQPGHQPIYNLGNHDKPRLATRIDRPAARTAAMMLLTLPGIPFVYYGDEIGMTDVHVPKELLQDPAIEEDGTNRDPQRTPMQWDDAENAGFSTGSPWLPVSINHKEVNVKAQQQDKASFLSLYKKLIHLRNTSDVLRKGQYRSLDLGSDIFGFVREYDGEKLIVLLNFVADRVTLRHSEITGKVLLSTYCDQRHSKKLTSLRPHEGIIIQP